MPEDFVRDVSPLAQISPVRPHPSNIKQQQRRQGKRDKRGSSDKKGMQTPSKASVLEADKVTIKREQDDSRPNPSSENQNIQEVDSNSSAVRHIDVRV